MAIKLLKLRSNLGWKDTQVKWVKRVSQATWDGGYGVYAVNVASRITCEGFRTSRKSYFNIFFCEVNYCSLKMFEISFCEDLGIPVVLGSFEPSFCRTWKNQPMFSTYRTKFLTKFLSVTYVTNRVGFER